MLSSAYQGVRKNRCVVYCGEGLQQKRLWPHSEGIRSWLRPHQNSFPPLNAPKMTPKNKINTEQYHLWRKRKGPNLNYTHNIAVTGPGACLRLLPLPEVAHDVVKVLAHQLLHPLQPGESLR